MSEQCKPFVGRNFRLLLTVAMAFYVVFISPIVELMGLQLYITVFIAAIVIGTFLHISRCDLKDTKKLLIMLIPSIASVILLLLYAIYFSSATLQLLGVDSTSAEQTNADLGDTFRNVWLLAMTAGNLAMPATIAWVAYGPATLASGLVIAAWGDSNDKQSVQSMGVLLMAVPLIIDLTLNLTGTNAGLITDLVPALNLLPQGGMFTFLRMLLNLIPDVVLFAFLAGIVEEAIAERYQR